jgi:riboflavin kinase/FMN adenylyltransferase
VPPVPPPIEYSKQGRWTPDAAACAVAVGNFDGVHVGHAAIVRRLVDTAGRLGTAAVVLTFDPSPAAIVRPDSAPEPLTTPRRRAELLLALGADAVCVQPADAALVAIEAEDFYREILRGRLRAAALVEGLDFRFGARRRGDIDLLRSLCGADGISLETVAPVQHEGESVSSSRLRRLIAAGEVRAARSMLTAAYRLTGTVVEGARRGRTIGFPTANLGAVATLLPAHGVYAARAAVAGRAESWPAAVHVGPNVTFGATVTTVEAHLIGCAENLYGATLDVDFIDRLRDTRSFASVDELKTQLARDVALAAEIARGDDSLERTP